MQALIRLEIMSNDLKNTIEFLEERITVKEAEAEEFSYEEHTFHRGLLDGSIQRLEGRKEALEEQKRQLDNIIAIARQEA